MIRPNYFIPIEKYKLLYVQVPKCANTSILMALGKLAGWKDFPTYVENNPSRHHDIQEAVRKRKMPVNEDNIKKFKAYHKFTFVRNPWDRIVSCWKDKVKYKERKFVGFNRWRIGSSWSFEDFVKRIATISDQEANDHFRSQFYATSVGGRSYLDWFGKIEQSSDWAVLQDRIERQNGRLDNLMVLNKGKDASIDYKQYYNDKTQILIAKRYNADIVTFGYKF